MMISWHKGLTFVGWGELGLKMKGGNGESRFQKNVYFGFIFSVWFVGGCLGSKISLLVDLFMVNIRGAPFFGWFWIIIKWINNKMAIMDHSYQSGKVIVELFVHPILPFCFPLHLTSYPLITIVHFQLVIRVKHYPLILSSKYVEIVHPLLIVKVFDPQ